MEGLRLGNLVSYNCAENQIYCLGSSGKKLILSKGYLQN
jgi:hypothetical protein